jgi:hypothetical protein
MALGLWAPAAGAESGTNRHPAIYPPQKIPVLFSHEEHLKAGADCQTCHDSTRKSAKAGDWNLPKHPECEACHDIQGAQQGKKVDPPSSCQSCHPGFESTVQRAPARIDAPTANIHFNHQVHLEKKVDCKTCHQGVEGVQLATVNNLPKMATCLTCHDGKAASAECKTCHLTEPSGRLKLDLVSAFLRPMAGNPFGMDHGPRYEFTHGTRATLSRETCEACHSERDCQSCHNSLMKPLSVHPNDFIALHPLQARADVTKCQSCHRAQSFCTACHERAGAAIEADASLQGQAVKVHPDYNAFVLDKGPRHHSIQASRDIMSCIGCHREETCIQCHSDVDRGGKAEFGINPHPAGFAQRCKQLAGKNDRACLKCHREETLVAKGCR